MKEINESQKLIARIHHVNMEKKQSDETYGKKAWAKTPTFKETVQYDPHIAKNPMVVHVHVLDRI